MTSTINREKTPEKRLFARLFWVLVAVSLICYMLFAFAIAPLTAYVNNDQTINVPFLPDLLELSFHLLNLLAFFTCYALTDYCMYRFKISKTSILVVVFSAITILKYVMNLVSDFFIFNTMPSNKEELKRSVATVVLNILGELAQFALVTLIAHSIIKKHKKLVEIAQKSARSIGEKYDGRSAVFPFKKIISKENPLQRTALITSICVSGIMVFLRLCFLIWTLFAFGGFATVGDVIGSVIPFFGDILFGVCGYFVMLFVFTKCDTADLTLSLDENK